MKNLKKKTMKPSTLDVIKAMRRGGREAEMELLGLGFHSHKRVHKRNCPIAIGLASQQGDSIVSVNYKERPSVLYPVAIQIQGVDHYHLMSDMIDSITNELNLSISSLSTNTVITHFCH